MNRITSPLFAIALMVAVPFIFVEYSYRPPVVGWAYTFELFKDFTYVGGMRQLRRDYSGPLAYVRMPDGVEVPVYADEKGRADLTGIPCENYKCLARLCDQVSAECVSNY